MLDWWTRRSLWRLAMRNWSWFSLRTRPRSVRPKTSMSDGAGRGGSAEAAEPAFMGDPYRVSARRESAAPSARSQGRYDASASHRTDVEGSAHRAGQTG